MIRVALSAPEGTTRPSSFPKLAKFTVSALDPVLEPKAYLPTEALLLSFYLPEAKTLSFNTAPCKTWLEPYDPASTGYERLKWPLGDPPLAASLTTLRLDSYTPVPADSIEALLRQTPNLQSLICNCRLLSSSPPHDLSALRQGLHQLRGTLTRLVFSFKIFFDKVPVTAVPVPVTPAQVTWDSLGPLGGLTSLEDLEISLAGLFGKVTPDNAPPLACLLPRGLKRLVIIDEEVILKNCT